MFAAHANTSGSGPRPQRRRGEPERTLAALTPGQSAVIATIEDDVARAQAVRFGMGEGAQVSCITVLPAGPVVVRSGRQEIAVGRHLARRIGVVAEGN